MKLTVLSLLALSASAIHARFIEKHETNQVVLNGAADDAELYLIELAPGKTLLVTEEEKWELRRVNFALSDRNLS
jgi:bacterial leucyl aminopeptidase